MNGGEGMRKIDHFILKDQSGVALIIALIMIIVLTLLGLASTFTSTFEIKMSGNKRGTTDAFYAADSGVQVTVSNINNFDLPGRYVSNQYNPFSEKDQNSIYYNPNPTNATVLITYDPTQTGAPRGSATSALAVGYEHYLIESTGQDQMDLSLVKSTCTIQQKVVRLVPTEQGGY